MLEFVRWILFTIEVLVIPYIFGEFVIKEKGILTKYVYGNMFLFSVFYLLTIICIHFSVSLSTLRNMWLVFTFIFLGIYLIKKMKNNDKGSVRFHVKFEVESITIVVAILLAGVCAFFSIPMDVGDSIETALATYNSGQLYLFNPYTGMEYGEAANSLIMSPYPVYYAVLARIVGMNPVYVIYYVIPFLFYVLIFGTIMLIGKELFITQKKKITFLGCVLVLYMFGFYGSVSQAQLLFLNPWEGVSVFVNMILPLLLLQSIKELSGHSICFLVRNRKFREIISFVCICVAGQLFYDSAMFFELTFLLIWEISYWLRRTLTHAGNFEIN